MSTSATFVTKTFPQARDSLIVENATAACAAADEPSEVDVEELVNVFCDMHTTPVRATQRMQVRCDICGELLSGLVLFHMTEKHEAMVESFLTSAVEELEGSVVPAEMGMLSMMDMEFTKESEQINSKAYTFDSEAGTRDLTGSGLEYLPYSRKSFTKESEQMHLQTHTFDTKAATFDSTGSALESIPCSRKSFYERGRHSFLRRGSHQR